MGAGVPLPRAGLRSADKGMRRVRVRLLGPWAGRLGTRVSGLGRLGTGVSGLGQENLE
jgi:hypothetical protein